AQGQLARHGDDHELPGVRDVERDEPGRRVLVADLRSTVGACPENPVPWSHVGIPRKHGSSERAGDEVTMAVMGEIEPGLLLALRFAEQRAVSPQEGLVLD